MVNRDEPNPVGPRLHQIPDFRAVISGAFVNHQNYKSMIVGLNQLVNKRTLQ